MNLARLSWTYLWARPLATLLHLLLLSLGLAAISLVLLVSEQVEQGLRRDLAGIDLVVGAKGSPLQLILSGVFHLDVPTGNIPAEAVQRWRAHPLVETVIPVSLGDSYRGFRIVGTEPAYLEHYGAKLAQGRSWAGTLEAVLGAEVAARTGLRPGDRFVGVHGLGREGEAHGDTPYTVVGVLERSGRVLDRLILTSTESVHEGLGDPGPAGGRAQPESRTGQQHQGDAQRTARTQLAQADQQQHDEHPGGQDQGQQVGQVGREAVGHGPQSRQERDAAIVQESPCSSSPQAEAGGELR